MLPDEPTPTNSAPVFGSIARWRLAWPWTMPKTPFLVIMSSPTTRGVGLRCSGGTSAARCSTLRPGRNAPTRCGTRQIPSWSATSTSRIAPGQTVGSVEAFGMALDPVGLAVAVLVAQQGEIADPLLGHDDVAVRQDKQPPGIRQAGRERRRGESLGHARNLAGIGDGHRPAGDDGAGMRRRQVLRLDREVTAELLVRQRRRDRWPSLAAATVAGPGRAHDRSASHKTGGQDDRRCDTRAAERATAHCSLPRQDTRSYDGNSNTPIVCAPNSGSTRSHAREGISAAQTAGAASTAASRCPCLRSGEVLPSSRTRRIPARRGRPWRARRIAGRHSSSIGAGASSRPRAMISTSQARSSM